RVLVGVLRVDLRAVGMVDVVFGLGFGGLVASAGLVEVVLQRVDQFLGVGAGQGGDGVHRAVPAQFGHEPGAEVVRVGQHVELVEHQPARLLVQGLVVAAQFLDDGAGLLGGVGDRIFGGLGRSAVDQVQQHAGAREVAQEQV